MRLTEECTRVVDQIRSTNLYEQSGYGVHSYYFLSFDYKFYKCALYSLQFNKQKWDGKSFKQKLI